MKLLNFSQLSLLAVIFYFSLVLATNEKILQDAGPVVFANIIFRHGARTPEHPYANDPYKNRTAFWPIGWGQLTNIGKMQHYKLGQSLRNRYEHLIPDGEYSADLIYVQSTDMDRTLMSAYSNLAGLFPPDNKQEWSETIQWQPIPVHTTPENLDKTLAMKYPCQKYEEYVNALMNSKEIVAYNKQHQPLYDYLTEHAGQPVTCPKEVDWLYITLQIQVQNNYTLPNWTDVVFPDKMYPVAAFSFALPTYTKKLQRLKTGPLIKEMIGHMDLKRIGKLEPDRNLWIYSGHDTTVANVLNTLGVFDMDTPPFCATVLIELRKNVYNEYSVTVFYKKGHLAEPELLTIPGCTAACPLDKFKALMHDIIPLDWDSECHSHQLFDLTSGQPYNSLAIFAMVTSTLLVFFLLASTSLYWHKQKPSHAYKKLKMETL